MLADFPLGSSRQRHKWKCSLLSCWGVRRQSLERGHYVMQSRSQDSFTVPSFVLLSFIIFM